jgi:hypothetical protein
VDTSAALFTLDGFTLNGVGVSLPDTMLSHVTVAAAPLPAGNPGPANAAYLYTNDTYVGADGQAHETQQAVLLGPAQADGRTWGWLYQVAPGAAQGSLFVALTGFANQYAFMGPSDTGMLAGAAGIQNTYITAGGYASMTNSGGFGFISGARYVYGYAANATDIACHYDGSAGSALVMSGTAYSFMLGTDNGQSFFNEAVGFQTTYGVAQHPGQDTAIFYDTPDDDCFAGRSNHAYLYSNAADGTFAMFNYVQGFALVDAYAFQGGIDYAYVYDTTVNHTTGFIPAV